MVSEDLSVIELFVFTTYRRCHENLKKLYIGTCFILSFALALGANADNGRRFRNLLS